MTREDNGPMDECIHSLNICPDCGGLQITEYTELNGVTDMQIGSDSGEARMLPTGTRIFWTPGPTPCEPEADGSQT